MEPVAEAENAVEEDEEEEEEEEEEEVTEEEVDLRDELQKLEDDLSSIDVGIPECRLSVRVPEVYLSECPKSYKENTEKEKHLLEMADNYHSQYILLYPDRKPLILSPVNECGIKKFVSTTLRPTVMPYPVLNSWEGCASLVADFLNLELLEPPTDPPSQLFSPTLVLRTRRGSCFEFSNLLCSLLLGAGYDAYCVSGYAVKDICLRSQALLECPLLDSNKKESTDNQEHVRRKYSVKSPRNLSSKFALQQEKKLQAEAEMAALQLKEEAEKQALELEKPPPDPLYGLRVHSWVLVLSGRREVQEDFFIDPLTGRSFATNDDNFLGIESVWNHKNYWTNIQDCRLGCRELAYDLGDIEAWEYLICCIMKNQSHLMGENEEHPLDDDEDKAEEEVYEMPHTWVSDIEIPMQDMEKRYPDGMKVIQYRKSKLEKFAPYLLPDGLVTRLTTYTKTDSGGSTPCVVKEWFQNRGDYMEERELTKATNLTHEKFAIGHTHCLKSHRYVTLVPETERHLVFYNQVRLDDLASRDELPSEVTEKFVDRSDFLYYRHVVFDNTEISEERPILKIEERFHRNKLKPASEDVAKRIFHITENQIEVTYHLEDDRIIPARCVFIKPRRENGYYKKTPFTWDMVSSFEVDPLRKPKTLRDFHKLLGFLMKEEDSVVLTIRESEQEVRDILDLREKEGIGVEIEISIYDTARNVKVHQNREAQIQRAAEEEKRLKEKELNYLAPFLAQLGDPEVLTPEEALSVQAECLADFKLRLVNKASRIQARFEEETERLQEKQEWYHSNQLCMSKADEDEYLAYCSSAMFRINVLKQRLTRYKDEAPQKYLALEEKLRRDPRLSGILPELEL